ncbi:MAG: enoyl-CoA hydratase/isomerase family protein [Deltaproteobacteria bacterium]|nr:enoyl-CoA hydratase/isomerase family protein [Deltaproteobacteria bacterium]MBW2396155.1 enoyl-CoA hydratase/isomerase family protein [Deltaproteobacteria bacterium]
MADALLPQDLVEQLGDPAAFERWSALTGDGVLVLDLRGRAGGLTVSPAAERLTQLPAVSVAWVEDEVEPGLRPLAAAVDVLVQDPASFALLRSVVSRTPLAALALVQLLRHSEGRSIHDGLTAESWVYGMLQAGPEFATWLAAREPRAIESSREPAVRITRDGDRLELVLNRPERRNAFSAAMRDGLCEGLALVHQDPTIRSVELRGAGPSFSSGGDLDEFGSLPDPATAHAVRSTRNPGRLLAEVAGRVHAYVHGACVGAGVELPAFCTRVTARPDAFFLLPEIEMGLVPGAGGTVSLPRRIGRQRTAWLALSGERLSAESALAWGLVDEVADIGTPR